MKRSKTPKPPPGNAPVVPMTNLLQRLLGVAAVVLGLSGLTAGFSEHRAAREQTRLPLGLRPGEIARTHFRTAGKYALDVSVEFRRDRGVAPDKLDELTLARDGPLDVGWRVRQWGVELAAGNSRRNWLGFFGTPDRQGVVIGRFKPPAAGTYEIEALVGRTLDALEATEPTLRLGTDPAEAQRAGFRAVVCTLIGVVLVGLGGLLLARAFKTS